MFDPIFFTGLATLLLLLAIVGTAYIAHTHGYQQGYEEAMQTRIRILQAEDLDHEITRTPAA